jgi:threonylcarbamoyladenosine tRNA methylthiotransferase MtaB
VRTFFVHNFGCRASQADGAALESLLARRGLIPAPGWDQAELVVLNSCTVTQAADDDLRQTVRRVNRQNPEAKILVTGCYAQRSPEQIAGLEGVAWVVGNSDKLSIPDIVVSPESEHYHSQIHVNDIFASQDFLSAPVEEAAGDRSRPNLKIQDGCNNRCSFCVIPYVRGRSRSMPADQVLEQVRGLARNYREVVLSGINLGRWGREPGSRLRLADLLRRLLAETEIDRLRLSSVEPMDLSDDLLALMAESPRIARHVHAPLQSGSDTVLRRMHRKYRPHHYAGRVLKARQWMPDAAIGADVMAGFPGETDAEFDETYRFIDSLPLTYLHVFTFSARPGTPAAALPGQIPILVKKERNRLLRDLAHDKNRRFREGFIGSKVSAVTMGGLSALSGNFLRIELSQPREGNQLLTVEVGGLTPAGLKEREVLPIL